MRCTALAVSLVFVAAAVIWAEGPDPATPSAEALGQKLPTRAYYGGCTMPEEAQALLGNMAPPGYEAGPRSTDGRLCEIEIPACYYFEGESDCYDE
jgi:hypothetical protein